MGLSKGRMRDKELRSQRQRCKKRLKQRAQAAKLSPRKK